MSKKSHHFLMLWPWPLTYDLEKLIRSGHYHYQCVYQISEQSIQWFLSYRVNTIAGGGRRAAGGGRRAADGGRLRRKTITSPDPSDTGNIIRNFAQQRFVIMKQYLIISLKYHLEWTCIHADTYTLICWLHSAKGMTEENYRETSNISCTLVGNKIVDHSDVVGASPVGAAPTTFSFST